MVIDMPYKWAKYNECMEPQTLTVLPRTLGVLRLALDTGCIIYANIIINKIYDMCNKLRTELGYSA